jgi:hypothetical protein
LQKFLFLTKYSQTGASSRYRSFQHLPFLKQAGISYDVSPLFDDTYLDNLYRNGKGAPTDVLRAFARRIGTLLKQRNFDLLFIEYELFPYLPACFERLLHWPGVRYIVDYDDALFHQYEDHARPVIQKLLGNKIGSVMRQAGAKQVETVPDGYRH